MKHRNSRMLLSIGRFGRGPAWRDAPTDTGGDTDGGGDGGDDKVDSGTGDGTKKPVIKGDLDPERLASDYAKARADAKAAKESKVETEKKHQAMLDSIAVSLGLKPDPKSDPAALVATAAQERDAAKTLAAAKSTELAIYKAAGKAGANADALLDSRAFLKQLGELDVSADDFGDKVAVAVAAAVKANPTLATKPPTGRMGADITGSGGTGGTGRSKDLASAVHRKLGGS